ncbi:MAG: prolyl oligopeptidase family protein [Phycisphaerales bacterium]
MHTLSIALALVLVVVTGPAAAANKPPETPQKQVTNTYHGVEVVDEYQWLENWDDPAVKAWSEAQNAHAREHLDALPGVEALRTRITRLLSGGSVEFAHLVVAGADASRQIFAIKHEPAKQQPMLVVLASPDQPAQARTLVDPNQIDPSGGTTIDWYVPSPDGTLVAVSMSEGGSESGTVHVFNVATGARTGDVIPRAHGGTAGGSLAWTADGRGFYYTRYPRAGERPEGELDFHVQVYYHALGTPEKADRYEVGKEFPRIAEIMLEEVEGGGFTLASVQNGDGGEFMHFLRQETRGTDGSNAPGKWTQLTRYEDLIVHMVFGHDGFVYAVSNKDALRGKVMRMSLKSLGVTGPEWVEVVPQDPKLAIETDFFDSKGLKVIGDTLVVLYQAGGPNELRVFDTRSGFPFAPAPQQPVLPPICTVNEVVALGTDMLVSAETYLTPAAWYVVRGSDLKKTALFQTSPADYSDCEVVREFATSKDGTQVPVHIIRRKGTLLNGNNPTLVYGYGGYGVNITPTFSPRRRAFIEQGGVYVIANIRGGGEYGEEWHRQGNLTQKQNVFDDFHAAANHVIARGYTKKSRLCIMGGSNGGLLMGATLTQHPDLCACVVSVVGIYDMLRVELSPNGAFNITEFGTVKDKAQFAALYAYSPLHHVRDGVRYPAVLMLTGANDPRVDPMQSRKMIARLQAADPEGLFLLRTSANAGHGIGSSLAQQIEENVDVYGFIMARLGMTMKPVQDDMSK